MLHFFPFYWRCIIYLPSILGLSLNMSWIRHESHVPQASAVQIYCPRFYSGINYSLAFSFRGILCSTFFRPFELARFRFWGRNAFSRFVAIHTVCCFRNTRHDLGHKTGLRKTGESGAWASQSFPWDESLQTNPARILLMPQGFTVEFWILRKFWEVTHPFFPDIKINLRPCL